MNRERARTGADRARRLGDRDCSRSRWRRRRVAFLSFDSLSPWLVTYAIGLFAALFAAPFAIHRGLGGLLEADARWERAILWWAALTAAVLAVALLCRARLGLRLRTPSRARSRWSPSPSRCSSWRRCSFWITRRLDAGRLTGQSVVSVELRRGLSNGMSLRVAAIQLNSTADKAGNIDAAARPGRGSRRRRRDPCRAAREVEPSRGRRTSSIAAPRSCERDLDRRRARAGRATSASPWSPAASPSAWTPSSASSTPRA